LLVQYIFGVACSPFSPVPGGFQPFLAIDGRILNFRRSSKFSSVYARAVHASLY